MSFPELVLDNQLCFLVHRLDQSIVARYRPLLAELGLTYPQYLAMMALWEKRELGIGELCEMLDLDTGTVSPLAKRLEAAGLVERARRQDDERSVTIRLTQAGADLEERAKSVPHTMASCLVVSDEEYQKMRGMLRTMLSRVQSPECEAAEKV